MTFQVQDNRSNTLDKRPLPNSLLDGQTAINYNNGSPGLFFRTSSGALAKVGPVAIGATAPVPNGWESLSVGEMWLDTNVNVLKVYDGTNWVATTAATTTTFIPPTSSAGLPSGAVWNNNGTLSIVS